MLMLKHQIAYLTKQALKTGCATALGAVLLSGCGGKGISEVTQYRDAPQVRPDNIYVYTFGITPDSVTLNSGLFARLASHLSAKDTNAEKSAEAMKAQEEVANEIVRKLQAMHLKAIRSDVPPPLGENVLLVTGNFEHVDAGNRARRVLIGLGAGKSEVSAAVKIWFQPVGQSARLVESFDASANSGKMPGVAETLGIGAVTGGIATAAAAGAGLHGVAETTHARPVNDAERMADSIARQLAQIGVAQGWLARDAIE